MGREDANASSRGSCPVYVAGGAIAGAIFGLAAGACFGTYDAFYKYIILCKIPGLLKIRYIGKYTLLAAAA